MIPAAWAAALLWSACTCRTDEEIRRAFDAAKAEALAEPPPLRESWPPDAVLHLSPALVAQAVSLGRDRLPPVVRRIPLGESISLEPNLAVEEVTIEGEGECPTCLVATVSLSGVTKYVLGPLGGEVPTAATASIEVALEVAGGEGAPGFRVSAVPRAVRRVTLPGLPLPKTVIETAESQLREIVEQEFLQIEPVPLLALGARDLPLPLRGLRVVPEGRGLRIAMRSGALHAGRIGKPDASDAPGDDPPGDEPGWTLELALPSVVSIGRREAFAAGPVAFDVVGVPESLTVEGDRFDLALRLWRTPETAGPTRGAGWWRDYRATGTLRVEGSDLLLEPDEIVETAASPRAGRADPVAMAAAGRIRTEMANALHQSVPAGAELGAAGVRIGVAVQELSGDGDTLTVRGTATLAEAPPPEPRGRKGKARSEP